MEVTGWCPFEERVPESDDEHFEALTAAVFQARFSPEVVRARWECIGDALAGFRVREVAGWPDTEVERLLAEPGVIRNRKKMMATLRNARDLVERADRHGSARAYLDSFRPDYDALVADIDTWAHYIGAPSIRWFLSCVRIPERWK